jgi:hypothetical protein
VSPQAKQEASSQLESQPYERKCLLYALFIGLSVTIIAETLGLAASVIAVIDLSAKVTLRYSEYYSNIKNTRDDIERLQRKAQGLKVTLKRVQLLYNGPNSVKLQESQSLGKGVEDYRKQLA